MAWICLSVCSGNCSSKTLAMPSTPPAYASPTSSSLTCSLFPLSFFPSGRHVFNHRRQSHVVYMAPEEEKLTRRNPLDFPIEWERPRPGRRPDIFPQFSPMKTPLPPPLPYDPPEEDEEEEEKKEEEEEEEDPKKEEPDMPEKQ